jgi:hypothetical protein
MSFSDLFENRIKSNSLDSKFHFNLQTFFYLTFRKYFYRILYKFKYMFEECPYSINTKGNRGHDIGKKKRFKKSLVFEIIFVQ